MKLALVYGTFTTKANGKFDIEGLYRTRGLTGSESFFFNTAKGLRELGHEVTAFCDVEKGNESAPTLAGARVLDLTAMDIHEVRYDAVLSWNEPDYLATASPGSLRVCVQQLNDWTYAQTGFDRCVDLYISPSHNHRRYMGKVGLDMAKIAVVPNCINTEFYADDASQGASLPRHPHRVIYCSSPDRGLHHLLEMWPAIRERVPDAELRVFYTIKRWLDLFTTCFYIGGVDARNLSTRAMAIKRSLDVLGENGENGVTIVGPRPNTEMAKELMGAAVLVYPCDPICYTEGFSVSIMDGCAAGALPIISDADAIGEVYRGVAEIIPGKPHANRQKWIDTIVLALTDEEYRRPRAERAIDFALRNGRLARARQWEDLLVRRIRSTEITARTLEFRGIPYRVAVTTSSLMHPSWYSFEDEAVVRERHWKVAPGDVVLDVGAAYGSYSLSALASGADHVCAWSPEAGPCEAREKDLLLHSAKLNGWEDKVEIYDHGVYDRDGFIDTVTQQFYEQEPKEKSPSVIRVTSLDSWATEERLESLGHYRRAWMKLDVEGAEYHVLRGATNLIRRLKPTILVENHIFKDPSIEDRVRELLKCGFGYREVSTEKYHSVSHSLYEPA